MSEWKWVPVEPTEKMLTEGAGALCLAAAPLENWRTRYQAMLAAAPAAEPAQVQRDERATFLAWLGLPDADPALYVDLWRGWQARAALQAHPAQHPATGGPVAYTNQSALDWLADHGDNAAVGTYLRNSPDDNCDVPLYAAPVPVEDARTQEADARRYRWLRNHCTPKQAAALVNYKSGVSMDWAIDRAIDGAALASPPPAQEPSK